MEREKGFSRGLHKRVFVKILLLGTFYSISLAAQSVKEKLETAIDKLPHPSSVEDFAVIPHLSSMNQDSTLVCWSFATSSFIESEMKRLGRRPVILSVMFPVYYRFVEKANKFIQSYGVMHFNPGDLFSGVIDVIKNYGIVPAEAYEGIKVKQTMYNHNKLYSELGKFMKEIEIHSKWNDSTVIGQCHTILKKHPGTPPEKFVYGNKEYTPKSFFAEIVSLPLEEYLNVTSFQYAPFNQFIELRVPDNWKHDTDYFNLPLEIFYRSFKNAVAGGYTVAIDMDNSEKSYKITKQYAFIPEFEVPKDSITQDKREEQFLSGATTDDHLMHVVSYKKFGKDDWFLVKDSWRTAWEGPNWGYYFFHESYIKLKVLAFLVHRSVIPQIEKLVAPLD